MALKLKITKSIDFYINEFSKLQRRRKRADARGESSKHTEVSAEEALGYVLKLTIKNAKLPVRSEFKEIGHDTVSRRLGTMEDIREELRKSFDELKWVLMEVDNLPDEELASQYHFKTGTYIITGAVLAADVHKEFLQSINTFCDVHGAQLLVLPVRSPMDRLQRSLNSLYSIPSNMLIVNEDITLGKFFHVSPLKISAKFLNPTQGAIRRVANKKGSFIFGSPKQHLRVVSKTRQGAIPSVIMTSGVLTKPSYFGAMYTEERLSAIAEADHTVGAIIVNIDKSGYFSFRQIQALSSGSFVDLGVKYTPDGVERAETRAFVMGDVHTGEEDPSAVQQNLELMEALRPETLFLHDLFNGKSINPHERKKAVTRMRTFKKHGISLESELALLRQFLEKVDGTAPEINIVNSNHDEFLTRYLESGDWIKDPQNGRLCLKLVEALLDNDDNHPVLADAVSTAGLKSTIRWLGANEDYIIEGIQMAAHGHLGPTGSRGTVSNLEQTYVNYFGGHTHSPSILRGGWRVGTASLLDLDYKQGPDAWLHASGTVSEEGTRQLFLFIHEESAAQLIAQREVALKRIKKGS